MKYLTRSHVSQPGAGCVMAALGVEAARQGADVQRVFANGTQRTIDKLSAGLSGTPAERRAKAIRTLATLRLSSIVTVGLGAAVLVKLVYARDRSTPTPGVRTAIELVGKKTQVPLTSQHATRE